MIKLHLDQRFLLKSGISDQLSQYLAFNVNADPVDLDHKALKKLYPPGTVCQYFYKVLIFENS